MINVSAYKNRSEIETERALWTCLLNVRLDQVRYIRSQIEECDKKIKQSEE